MKNLRAGTDIETRQETSGSDSLYGWWALIGLLGIVFIVCSVFYIWLYIQQVQNGYRLARLYEEHEQLVAVERKLHLEWSRFQDPFQLEELGQKEFRLAPPRPEQKLVTR